LMVLEWATFLAVAFITFTTFFRDHWFYYKNCLKSSIADRKAHYNASSGSGIAHHTTEAKPASSIAHATSTTTRPIPGSGITGAAPSATEANSTKVNMRGGMAPVLQCPNTCKKTFKGKHSQRDYDQHVPSRACDPFQCPKCGRWDTGYSKHRSHVASCTVCEKCGRSFTGSQKARNYRNHVEDLACEDFYCSTCNKSVKGKTAWNRFHAHSQGETNPDPQPGPPVPDDSARPWVNTDMTSFMGPDENPPSALDRTGFSDWGPTYVDQTPVSPESREYYYGRADGPSEPYNTNN
jgi:hypothetical protein